ncbi:MAG: hypothetical protein QM710_15395 [Flavobacterium sp.]
MKKINFLLLLFCWLGCKKNENNLPPEKRIPVVEEKRPDLVSKDFPKTGNKIQDFIKGNSYEILDEIYGDLNNDAADDAVLVVRAKNDTLAQRTLLVLLKKEGAYELFGKNETVLGPEYYKEGPKINDSENISIKNHRLNITIYCQGPCGNTWMTFSYDKEQLVLSHYRSYDIGAGAHLETEFDSKSKMATVSVTNMMRDEMPTETEKKKLDYKKSLEFSQFKIEDLSEAILGNSKLSS